jgi:hypothetical protein
VLAPLLRLSHYGWWISDGIPKIVVYRYLPRGETNAYRARTSAQIAKLIRFRRSVGATRVEDRLPLLSTRCKYFGEFR